MQVRALAPGRVLQRAALGSRLTVFLFFFFFLFYVFLNISTFNEYVRLSCIQMRPFVCFSQARAVCFYRARPLDFGSPRLRAVHGGVWRAAVQAAAREFPQQRRCDSSPGRPLPQLGPVALCYAAPSAQPLDTAPGTAAPTPRGVCILKYMTYARPV